MPVLAIVPAVFAIAAAVTIPTVFTVIAAVGATIAAVGAITKNKTLAIVGGVIGAVGGIGALAQSAGIIGSDASLFGSFFSGGGGSAGASAGTSIESEIAQWSQYGADLDMQGNIALSGASAYAPGGDAPLLGAQALEGAPTTASQAIDPTTGSLQSVDASASPQISAASGPDVTPTGAIDSGVIPQGDSGAINAPGDVARTTGADATTNSILNGGTGVPSSTAPAAPATPEAYGPPASAAPDVTGAPSSGTTVTGAPTAEPYGPPASAAPSPSVWAGIKDFLKDNSRLAAGVVQAGASFIAGATNGLTPAQIAALQAQAEANQAAANLSRMQQSNMSQPLPVASRVPTPPVTGAPAGIINTPPPQRPGMGAA